MDNESETESNFDDVLQEIEAMVASESTPSLLLRNPLAMRINRPEDSMAMRVDETELSYLDPYDLTSKVMRMKTGENDIVLDFKDCRVHNRTNPVYERNLINRCDVWHQVLIHHEGMLPRAKIIDLLFAAVPVEELSPVAYRRHINIDTFLVRLCSKGLIKLFEHGLCLRNNGTNCELHVRLNVAKYEPGQVVATSAIVAAVNDRFQKAAQYGNVTVLNLDKFREHPFFGEVCVSLQNQAHFDLVCDTISRLPDVRSRINSIQLSNNGLCHLLPLTALKDLPIHSLDLRFNELQHASILKPLQALRLSEVHLEGNPLQTRDPDYLEMVQITIPNLVKVDGHSFGTKTWAAVGEEDEAVEMTGEGILVTADTPTFRKYRDSPHWHLVTVHHNGKYKKREILDTLSEITEACEFYPCYYKTYSKRDEFLIMRCFEAMLLLVQKKLQLEMKPRMEKVVISLRLNVAEFREGQVSVKDKLAQLVAPRCTDRCVNLNGLQRMFDTVKNVELSVRNRKILSRLIDRIPKTLLLNTLVVSLRNNGFKNCTDLTMLARFPKLSTLDLRQNEIATFDDLAALGRLRIKELFLDLNPICSSASSSIDYIRKVRAVFGTLEKLDGVSVSQSTNMRYCQNYICTPEAYKFTEQFVKHYFTMYDSSQRSLLKDMYHPTAQFSLTCNYQLGKVLEAHQMRLRAYQAKSRNLLKIANIDRAVEHLIVGRDRIANVLISFPETKHDLCSFRIDVPAYTTEYAIVTVHGAYKETGNTVVGEFMLGFMRTFHLRPNQRGTGLFEKAIEYQICNEMLHMYTLSSQEQQKMFTGTERDDSMEVQRKGEADKESTLIVFQELTKLNEQWSVRFLGEASWNLKLALNIFLKAYDGNHLPDNAFQP